MDAKIVLVLTNLAILVPLGYLAMRIREVSRMAQSTNNALRKYHYTKDETDKMIDLKLVPVSVALDNIKEDIGEVKYMLQQALQDKQ
jgi:hypothetical protein